MAVSDGGTVEKRRDMLLACLVHICKHYGRAKSPAALKAGTASTEEGIGPQAFCEAAENIGFKTLITKKANLKSIPQAVLPVVLILKDDQVCILMETNGKKATIFVPESRGEKTTDLKTLQGDYEGYAIYIHPEAKSHQTAEELDDQDHWFWSQIAKNKGIYSVALIGAIFINLFALTSPLFIMNVYDRVIPNNAIETGWFLGIGALVVFFFDFLIKTMRASLIDIAGNRIDVLAGRRIYDQVLNMQLASRPASSGVFANMLREFDSVRDFFTSATITILVDLPFSLFFLMVVYFLAGKVAFILLGLLIAITIVGFLIQFRLKALVKKSIRSSEAKHGVLVETIHGLETIKATGSDGRFRQHYTSLLADNALHSRNSRFWSGLGVNLAGFLQQIATVLVVLAGMYMVKDGNLSVGGLIAAVIIGGRAIAPIGQIANIIARYHQAGSALRTLEKIMKNPVERGKGKNFLHRPVLEGAITFDNVSFTYPHVNRQVLKNVSFKIAKGERVAFIGKIGSGKSTIARLMLGLYQPEKGTILIDETDSRQIDPADLRRNTAYIAQETFLFSGSVKENIAASVQGATEAQIFKAAQMAGVHDFISKHPMGYDAPVGENGDNLSGGQRQAIALARSILLNPNILVCDEPTNAMDHMAEVAFVNYVQNQAKGKTFILVTHKPALLSLVNRVIVIDQGQVVMDDTPAKVMQALGAGENNAA